MQPLWAVLSLAMPGISASIIYRRVGIWVDRTGKVLIALFIYVILFLLPIHIFAALELLRLINSVSLLYIVLFEVFILLALLLWFHFHPATANPPHRNIAFISHFHATPKYVVISVGILAICYAGFAIGLLTSYPAGYDGVAYHLPLAVRWLQDGSLKLPPSKHWMYSMPGNAEIPMMVLLSTGWQALAPLFSSISTVILACSCYLIALKCGASRRGGFIATLILLSLPIIQFQTFSTYVDLYGSSFFMAAVALFLYRYDTSRQGLGSKHFSAVIVLSGLACGIAIGTKPTFWIYAVVFFITALITFVIERHRHGKSLVFLASLTLIAMLVPSVFWFGRAFLATGNPFYPLKIEIMGVSVFDGYSTSQITPANYDSHFIRSRIEWLIYPWTEYKRSGYNYSSGCGFGAAFAAFVPLGVLYTLYIGFQDRKQNRYCSKRILTLLFLVGLVIWWFALRRMPRFGIPLLVLACVLSSSLIDLFLRSRSRLFGLLLVCSLTTTCLVSVFYPSHVLLGQIRAGNWTRSGVYEIPSFIDDLPQGQTILNLGSYNNFAFAGKRLSNKVISQNEVPSHLSQDFLRQRKVDYIVTRGASHAEVLQDIGVELVYDGTENFTDPVEGSWRVWKVILERKPKTPR